MAYNLFGMPDDDIVRNLAERFDRPSAIDPTTAIAEMLRRLKLSIEDFNRNASEQTEALILSNNSNADKTAQLVRLAKAAEQQSRTTIEMTAQMLALTTETSRQTDLMIKLTDRLRALTVGIAWLTAIAVVVGAIQTIPT